MRNKILVGTTTISGKKVTVRIAKTGPKNTVMPRDVLKAVHSLCKNRYVRASEFPSYLTLLCRKFFGTVRSAKWKAKVLNSSDLSGKAVIDGKKMTVNIRKTGPNNTVTPEDVLRAVYDLCNDRYVMAKDFPGYLRQLCKKYFKSVRGAKWQAKIIYGKKWTVKKFLKCVNQYCAPKYRSSEDWPENMRYWAVRFFGSVRMAKLAAKVLVDPRKKARQGEAVWSKERLLEWVWKNGMKKTWSWPGTMVQMCQIRFGSCRHAQWMARTFKDERTYSR